MLGPGLQAREWPTASGCPPAANLLGDLGRYSAPAAPSARAVEPVAVEHVKFVDQNDPVVQPPQLGDRGDGADRVRPGRFDSERKTRCGPDSRLNGREWLGRQVIKRGGELPGWYDRPGRAGDFGQLLRDIRRLPGCQRQIPGRSVRGNEGQHLTDVGGNLARQAATPCAEVGQAHTEGIDDASRALHFYEVSRGQCADMGPSTLTAGLFFPILADLGRHRELDGSGMLGGVVSYADQNEKDHQRLLEAISAGRVLATVEH
jgi:hypothetical protein